MIKSLSLSIRNDFFHTVNSNKIESELITQISASSKCFENLLSCFLLMQKSNSHAHLIHATLYSNATFKSNATWFILNENTSISRIFYFMFVWKSCSNTGRYYISYLQLSIATNM